MNNAQTSSGVGFAGLLTIVFITLKLTHVVNWSWWWVLCPMWAGLAVASAIFILVLGGILAFTVIAELYNAHVRRKTRACGSMKMEDLRYPRR